MTETPSTMGSYLRAARRRRRVSLERAAEETRIRPDYLMRMESDEFDFLAPAYVRGFIKTYGRFLRVNVDPLLEEFDRRYGMRIDTGPIVALERSSRRNTPREPRVSSSWTIAAVMAASVLLLLGVIGLLSGEEDPGRERSARDRREQPSGEPTVAVTETTPTPTPTPTIEDDSIAFTDGITLALTGLDHECWVTIQADGETVYNAMLQPGQSETFEAEEEMRVVLGYAAGVEMNINGRALGSPGVPDVLTFKLPDDIDTLL